MQQAAKKKKDAQEHYYNQQKSPVKKQNYKPQKQQQRVNNQIGSVQQRLGANNAAVFNNTNRKQFVPQVKQDKLSRIQNYKLNRVQNKAHFNNQQQFKQNKNKINNVRAINPRTGEVKFLRPLKRKNVNTKQPQNFTVSVGNTKIKQGMNASKHHVGTELNPALQQEIRIIQNKSTALMPQSFASQIPNATTDTRVPIMATRTTLHERFSRI